MDYVEVLKVEGKQRNFTLRVHPIWIFLAGVLAGYLLFA